MIQFDFRIFFKRVGSALVVTHQRVPFAGEVEGGHRGRNLSVKHRDPCGWTSFLGGWNKNVTWINETWEEIDPTTVAFLLGVSKNNGRPQIIHILIRFSIMNPSIFGGFPLFLETSIYVGTTPQPVTVTTRVIPFLAGI